MSLVKTALLLVASSALAEAKVRTTDAFMSSIDMKNLFRLEVAMVDVLRKQKEQLEAGLQSIRGYMQEGIFLYKR